MKKTYLLGALCMLALSVSANAAIVTYTDETSFLTALSGPTSTLDFDSTTAGTLIPSGNSLGGITFTYNIGGLDMKVVDDFDTTSPNNYLGLDDAGNFDQFIDGDEFTLSFSTPVSAAGMYFITGDPLINGDIHLVTSVGTALNSSIVDISLDDGGMAYYIGLISDTAFSSAAIQYDAGGGGNFLFNVDDITTSAVPIPGAIWLFGSGLLGLIGISRRRKQ
jgi:hypothetical protein